MSALPTPTQKDGVGKVLTTVGDGSAKWEPTALPAGVTASVDELNILDGVTADKDEINVLDAVTAGTAAASKAAVLGANKNLDTLVVADGGLKLGSGAGTAITSTAAEINTLDGIPAAATFTVGAESDDGITVTAQVKDANGDNISGYRGMLMYLSQSADGSDGTTNLPDEFDVNTGTVIQWIESLKSMYLCPSNTGAISVHIVYSGAATYYLVLLLPSGKLAVSGAITFAA